MQVAVPAPEPSATVSLPRRALEGARRFLFGHDVFISYARADAVEYAQALADALIRRRIAAYVDQLGTPPGPQMPPLLLLRLRLSSMLVLVASPAAARSQAVAQEVEEFSRHNHRVFVVDVGGALDGVEWYRGRIRGGPARRVAPAELAAAAPSEAVVEHILKNVDFARREDRLRRTMRNTLLGIVALLVVGGGGLAYATTQTQKARSEAGIAADSAVAARSRADAEAKRAAGEQARAAAAQAVADRKAREAAEAQAAADRAGAEAARAASLASAMRDSVEARQRQLLALDHSARAADLYDSGVLYNDGDPRTALQGGIRHALQSLESAWTPDGLGQWMRGMSLLPPRLFAAPAHEGPVRAMALDSSGRLLATTDGGDIRLWTLREPGGLPGEPGATLAPGPTYQADAHLFSVALSPDGHWLAGGSDDRTWVWDLRTGRAAELSVNGEAVGAYGAAFSPDGRLLAVAGGDTVAWLFEAGSWRAERVGSFDAHWFSVAFSPDGRRLALGGDKVELWDVAARRMLAKMESGASKVGLAFRPDGVLAVADANGDVSLWSFAERGDSAAVAGEQGEASPWSLTDEGRSLARARHEWTGYLTNESGESFHAVLGDGRNPLVSLSFTPGGRYLAATLGRRSLARVWEPGAEREVSRLPGAATAAFVGGGHWLAVGGEDGTVQLRPGGLVKAPARLAHPQAVTNLAFSPDSRWLATGGLDDTVRVYEAESRRRVAAFATAGDFNRVLFSPRGRWLAAVADTMVQVYAVESWRPAATLRHPFPIFELAFSPDERRLATVTKFDCGRDPRFFERRVWEVASGEELAWESPSCDATSPPVAGGRRGPAGLLADARGWARGGEATGGPGGVLTASHATGEVTLREAASGRTLIRLPEDGARALAFSPDGRWLAVGHDEGGVGLWPLGPSQLLVAEACARLPGGTFAQEGEEDEGAPREPDPCASLSR